jgi:hypothetical protein
MSPADRKKGRGGRQGAAAGQGRGQGQGGQGGAGGKGGKGGKGGGRHPKEAPTSVDEVAQLAGPLQQVLRRLPETQRRVLELRMGLVDGHPHDLADTARQLGISLSEARDIEQRAFAHIREAIPLGRLQKLLDR